MKGDKRVDLKEFRKKHGLRALSFASPEEQLKRQVYTPEEERGKGYAAEMIYELCSQIVKNGKIPMPAFLTEKRHFC